MPEQRLDAALAARGLARSRTHAASLIAAGVVTVDGRPAVKQSLKVDDTTAIMRQNDKHEQNLEPDRWDSEEVY